MATTEKLSLATTTAEQLTGADHSDGEVPQQTEAAQQAPAADANQLIAIMQMQMKQQQFQLEQMRLAQEQMLKISLENQSLRIQLEEANRGGTTRGSKRPDRPTIEPDLTDNEWSLFLDSWTRYKTMSNLTNDKETAIRNELREACSQEVNKMLFELYGPTELNSMNERQLMECIKKVAVNGVNKEVHWQTFFRINQNEGESISKFVARLKAQASLCNFHFDCSKQGCGHSNNFSELMVSHQMVSGLTDPECQSKMLAEAEELNSFEKKFNRLLSMESVLQTTPQLNVPPTTPSKIATQKSAYKKGKHPTKKTIQQEPTKKNWQCFGCGMTSHPGKSKDRINCPAWGKTCRSCNRANHFESVCRSTAKKEKGTSRTAIAHEITNTPYDDNLSEEDTPSRSLAASCSNETQNFRLSPGNGGFI